MLRNPACLEPLPDNLFYLPRKGDYVYFESPSPALSGPGLVAAAWVADAAMLSYARYASTRMQEAEFRAILGNAGYLEIEPLGDCFIDNAPTARGFWAANDDHALLAFRGTEKDNVHDVEADGDALLIDGGGFRVHQGFYRYLNTVLWRVRPLVASYRAAHPRQLIYMTGHSLGAALASLAFVYLNDTAARLYTLGCPRAGDQAFCSRLEANSGAAGSYRVVDNEDVVAHVPLLEPGFDYQHPSCTLLWFDPDGVMVTNPPGHPSDWMDLAHAAFGFLDSRHLSLLPNPLPRPLADHSPVRYCHWMWKNGVGK